MSIKFLIVFDYSKYSRWSRRWGLFFHLQCRYLFISSVYFVRLTYILWTWCLPDADVWWYWYGKQVCLVPASECISLPSVNVFGSHQWICLVPSALLRIPHWCCIVMIPRIVDMCSASAKYLLTSDSKYQWYWSIYQYVSVIPISTNAQYTILIMMMIYWCTQLTLFHLTSIDLYVSECDFMRMKPSTIATSCIISAIKGLKIKIDCEIFRHICALTNSPVELVKEAVNLLEWIVDKEASVSVNNVKCSSAANNCAGANVEKIIPVTADEEKPETPTDVQDVEFC